MACPAHLAGVPRGNVGRLCVIRQHPRGHPRAGRAASLRLQDGKAYSLKINNGYAYSLLQIAVRHSCLQLVRVPCGLRCRLTPTSCCCPRWQPSSSTQHKVRWTPDQPAKTARVKQPIQACRSCAAAVGGEPPAAGRFGLRVTGRRMDASARTSTLAGQGRDAQFLSATVPEEQGTALNGGLTYREPLCMLCTLGMPCRALIPIAAAGAVLLYRQAWFPDESAALSAATFLLPRASR